MDFYNKLALIAQTAAEKAAMATFDFIGKGDSKGADQAAVNAMRNYLNECAISGRVVIGEGERDKAPMLYVDEKLGKGGEEIDIAVDPLEGTNLCANSQQGAMSVIALGKKDAFLRAPDIYMQKIAIGAQYPKDAISLNNSVKENLTELAKHKKVKTSDLKIIILDRERHQEIIEEARSLNVNVGLIADGDISAALLSSMKFCRYVDMYIGIGGAPEGVLAAAGLKCLGAHMLTKLVALNDEQKERAKIFNIDLEKIYTIDDLVTTDAVVAMTGVTNGDIVAGIRKSHSNSFKAFLSTVIFDSYNKTMIRKYTTVL